MASLNSKLKYSLNQAVKKLIPGSLLPLVRSLKRKLSSSKRNRDRRAGRTIRLVDLTQDLSAANFRSGQLVMVHASLSKIGNVEGGADTVIKSWIDLLSTEGTLMMPCYNSADEMQRKFEKGQMIDLRTSPALTGKISETFRSWPNVFRSSHPFSSTCAWGQIAEQITSTHPASSFVCHDDSPVGQLIAHDGLVVGIGIGIAQGLGVAHYLEDSWSGFPFEVHTEPVVISYIDASGKKITREISRYNPKIARTRLDQPEGAWINEELTKHFAHKNILHKFRFGDSEAWWMSARELRGELKQLATVGITMYSTKQQLTAINRLPENW